MLEKLNSEQITFIILVFIAIYFGKSYFKAFLANKAKDRQLYAAETASEQETERLKVFGKLASDNHQLAVIKSDIDKSYDAALKAISKSESGKLYGQHIDADYAKQLIEHPRDESRRERLDGPYRVKKIDTSRDVGHRFQLKNQKTGEEFTAAIERTLIPVGDFDYVVNCAINHQITNLQINGLRLNGKIYEAHIVGITKEMPEQK